MSVKRKCKFNQNLQNDFPIFKRTENDEEAHCKNCNLTIYIGYKGKTALELHLATENHKKKLQSIESSTKLDKFFVPKNSNKEKNVRAAELALSYHTVMHQMSFRSLDCTTKLNSIIYEDSEIAKCVQLARTKCEAIIKEILGPLTIEVLSKDLNKKDLDQTYFFVRFMSSFPGRSIQ